ncbi:MAG TPA: phosphotransferase family protein [Steroidobacteraceae bacterium]|nr:phosphotransferase family protein [Steroidobacteraceae bacterium]
MGQHQSGHSNALTAGFLSRYLSSKWGEPCEVCRLEKFDRGWSRETWFLECRRATGDRPQNLVLRRDLPGGSIDHRPLRKEYEIYRRLALSPVPVARPLWWEDDPAWLENGREFYLREQIEGDWDVPHFMDPHPQYDALRIDTSKEHLRKLAILHRCDWHQLGFEEIMSAPASAATCARDAVTRLYDEWQTFRFDPDPVLTEGKEWLLANGPPAPCISLLKGNNGRGEEVFRNGQIVAMSDWESSSLGDPSSDLARCQDFIPEIERGGKRLWGLEQALEYYREVSGVEIRAQSVAYYRILNGVESAITLFHGVLPVIHKTNLLVRQTWLATEMVHLFRKLLLDAMCGRSTEYSRSFYNTQPPKTGQPS